MWKMLHSSEEGEGKGRKDERYACMKSCTKPYMIESEKEREREIERVRKIPLKGSYSLSDA